MTTIAEKIRDLRDQREANSVHMQKLREANLALSEQIRQLEVSITPPKKAAAKPGDVYMEIQPAEVKIKGQGPK